MPRPYGVGQSKGERHYECWDCPFDVLGDELRMKAHIWQTGHGTMTNFTPTLSRRVHDLYAQHGPMSAIIALGYLCWNTQMPSREGANGLVQEAARLRHLGASCNVFAVDNGSSDGTYEALKSVRPLLDLVVALGKNMGSCFGRNLLISYAMQCNAKYLLLMDGDIQVVPLSVYTMARYLDCHPDVGCVGAYPSNFTTEYCHTPPYCIEIPESRVKEDIGCAFTQYGLFRVSMFKDDGICFDEKYGPGWGYEDDDLYQQMHEKGWRNVYFNGMTYLHRNLHSSWDSLEREGHSVHQLFLKRKEYFLSKWAGRGVSPAILKRVEAQSFPQRAL